MNTLPIIGKKKPHPKNKSLCGLWRGAVISETLIEESKKSLFPLQKKRNLFLYHRKLTQQEATPNGQKSSLIE